MTDLQVTDTKRLDRRLEAAVSQTWLDLLPGAPSGQFQIEYETDDKGGLEFLKVWASTIKGHWNLVCEMWLQALWSNSVGLRFANDFHSEALAASLESATREAGSTSSLCNHHGFIQVGPPVRDEPSNASAPAIAAA